jgi:hypothetical protein
VKNLSSFLENDLNNDANSCTNLPPMIFCPQITVQHRRYEVFKTTLMVISLIMSGVSLGLLIYWLRYSCELILSAKSARDYTRDVAEANDLRFLQVQQELAQVRERIELDSLRLKVENDYRLLTYLLVHGPAFHANGDRVEQFVLMLNFKLLMAYYELTCRISVSIGKRALREMTQVVGYFANRMGERSAYAAVYR